MGTRYVYDKYTRTATTSTSVRYTTGSQLGDWESRQVAPYVRFETLWEGVSEGGTATFSNGQTIPGCGTAIGTVTIWVGHGIVNDLYNGEVRSGSIGTTTTSYGSWTKSSRFTYTSSVYGTGTYNSSDTVQYRYLGSDNIDPTAVGYSTTTPKGGETITINASARSNTYGGTISYLYQYSINGGSTWTNLTTTTATSASYTIPKGTQQFMVRVRASDNYGFTSTTYVTGANLTVKNTSSYAGIDGAVKPIESRVCVGGAIKTNVSIYLGVDGVVKQS